MAVRDRPNLYSAMLGCALLVHFAAQVSAVFIRLKSLSWKYSTVQKNDVHAFGYNSAESEPIWMKAGTM